MKDKARAIAFLNELLASIDETIEVARKDTDHAMGCIVRFQATDKSEEQALAMIRERRKKACVASDIIGSFGERMHADTRKLTLALAHETDASIKFMNKMLELQDAFMARNAVEKHFDEALGINRIVAGLDAREGKPPIPSASARVLSATERASLVEAWIAKGRTRAELVEPIAEDHHPDVVFNPPQGCTFGAGADGWREILQAEIKRRDLEKEGISAKRKGAEIITAAKGGRPAAVPPGKRAKALRYVRKLTKEGATQTEACEAAALEIGDVKPETIRHWLKQDNRARAGKN